MANGIFEELPNLYLIVLLTSFFPLLLRISAENRINLKLFIWTTELGGTQQTNKQTNKQTNCTWLATAIILVIYWAERDFCIISDCRNSFNNKFKNLFTSKKLFNPAKIQSPPAESLKEKCKRLLVCVPFSHGSIFKY